MAGDAPADNPNLKGLTRYFNSETNFGRANVIYPNFTHIQFVFFFNYTDLNIQCLWFPFFF